MGHEKQFWDESYNDCQECKRLDQALNKLRSENASLKSRVEILQDSVNSNTHESFHRDAYIETLHNWIKSDSVYQLLRIGDKNPSVIDDCEEERFFDDLYRLSGQLRKIDEGDNEARNESFQQQLP